MATKGIMKPDRYVARLSQVDIGWLVEAGIRLVLLDRDNTVVPRDTWIIPEENIAWCQACRAAGLAICLVSNNFHSTEVRQTAEALDTAWMAKAMKPFPFALRRVLKSARTDAAHAALIGDQLFTDVLAGHLAGIHTVLVHPLSRRDLWYTQILRLFEFPMLHGHAFEGEDGDISDQGGRFL